MAPAANSWVKALQTSSKFCTYAEANTWPFILVLSDGCPRFFFVTHSSVLCLCTGVLSCVCSRSLTFAEVKRDRSDQTLTSSVTVLPCVPCTVTKSHFEVILDSLWWRSHWLLLLRVCTCVRHTHTHTFRTSTKFGITATNDDLSAQFTVSLTFRGSVAIAHKFIKNVLFQHYDVEKTCSNLPTS